MLGEGLGKDALAKASGGSLTLAADNLRYPAKVNQAGSGGRSGSAGGHEALQALPALGIGGYPVVPAEGLCFVGGSLDAEEADLAHPLVAPDHPVVIPDLRPVRRRPSPNLEQTADVGGIAGQKS